MKTSGIGRREFVTRFMRDCGLSYEQAYKAYAAMISTIEDSVINGTRVYMGQLGVIRPVTRPARDVVMSFEKRGAVLKKIKRTFHVDERTEWRFRLFRSFEERHHLNGR